MLVCFFFFAYFPSSACSCCIHPTPTQPTTQTICGAASNWYFPPPADDGSKPRGDGEGMLADAPLSASMWRTIRYHLGTVSFASLIIAVIEFIRAVILYFEEKAKNTMNDTMRCIIFGCLSCFMKCVECFMNQINRNGLVFVRICVSAFCFVFSCN